MPGGVGVWGEGRWGGSLASSPTVLSESLVVPNDFQGVFTCTSHMPFCFRNNKAIRNWISNFTALTAAGVEHIPPHTSTHLAQLWISKAIKEMCSLVLRTSQGARRMTNARFRALGGNHSRLPLCHSDVTMATTKRLPSSVAKTIEILINVPLWVVGLFLIF